MSEESDLLAIARRLQALAQMGLHYTKDVYDKERFEEISEIALSLFGLHDPAAKEIVAEQVALISGPATPFVDTRGLVLDGERVLLVKESTDARWTLPGGFLEVGQTPSANIVKEVKEESGLDVEVLRLLGVHDNLTNNQPSAAFQSVKLFFHCRLLGGEIAVSGPEILDAGFFPLDALPEMSMQRSTPEQVALFAALARDPGAHAVSD